MSRRRKTTSADYDDLLDALHGYSEALRAETVRADGRQRAAAANGAHQESAHQAGVREGLRSAHHLLRLVLVDVAERRDSR